MKLHWLGLMIVGLAAGASAPPEDPAERDQGRLQGKWQAVKIEADGTSPPAASVAQWRFIFLGDTVMTKDGDKTISEGFFQLDPTKKPATIDISPTRVPQGNKITRGIYSLEGDTLKIALSALGEDRPEEFKSPAGAEPVVFTLKRAKR